MRDAPLSSEEFTSPKTGLSSLENLDTIGHFNSEIVRTEKVKENHSKSPRSPHLA
jgi:hypothetical protein